MGFATGVYFEVEDPEGYLEKTRPAVIIGNHQTELDVLMLGSVFPKYTSVSAKKSLSKTPILGWFMSLSGTVFIDRANRDNARQAMAGAAEVIRKTRQNVFMFPEGTRSYYKDPGMLPFKKGAFHLAIQAGAPIVPVVVENYSHVLYVQGWRFNSGIIRVKGEILLGFSKWRESIANLFAKSSSQTHPNIKPDHRGCRRFNKRYKRKDARSSPCHGCRTEAESSNGNANTRSEWRRSHQS